MPDSSDALKLFFEDCSSTPPLSLQVEREGQSHSYAFEQPFALIGREESNDVCLSDLRVSRRHAYVQLLGGTAFCLDIGERTGLLWEGMNARWGWLGPGRAVQMGPFRLRSSARAPGPPFVPNPLAAGSLDPSSPVCWRLEISGSTERAFTWKVARVLTLLGSSQHCKLQFPAGRISRFHCLFFCTPTRLWVVDLLSREGTSVDGERVRWRGLEDGSQIQIGRLSIRALKEVRSVASPAEVPDSKPIQPLPATQELVPVPAVASSSPLVPAPPSSVLLPVPAPGRPADSPAEIVTAQAAWLAPFFQQINVMQQQMFEQMQQMMLFMAQTFSSLHQEQTASLREELDALKRVTAELQALQLELVREPPRPAESASASAQTGPAPATPAAAPEMKTATPAPPTEISLPAARAPAVPTQPGDVVHAQLSQRIADLERERKTRWQKILGLMKG